MAWVIGHATQAEAMAIQAAGYEVKLPTILPLQRLFGEFEQDGAVAVSSLHDGGVETLYGYNGNAEIMYWIMVYVDCNVTDFLNLAPEVFTTS